MRKKLLRPIVAVLLAAVLAAGFFSVPGAGLLSAYADTRTARVAASTLNVRSGPGTSYSKVGTLSRGASVTVTDETVTQNGDVWVRVSGSGVNGYVLKSYLNIATSAVSDTDFETYLQNQGFPESYRAYLRTLHEKYPNWIFSAVNTGLEWDTVIQNESVVGRNLVHTDSRSSWKSTADGAYNWDTSSWPGFDSTAWVAASEDIVKYYMDPRNFLDERYIFQFLDQNFDASLQTEEGLKAMVRNTFLAGSMGTSVSGRSGSDSSSGPGVSGSSAGPGGSSSGLGSGSSAGPGSSSSGSAQAAPSSGSSPSGSSSGGYAGGVIGFNAPTLGTSGKARLAAPGTSAAQQTSSGSSKGSTSSGNAQTGTQTPGNGSSVSTSAPGSGSSVTAAPGSTSSGSAPGGSAGTAAGSYTSAIMQAAQQSGVNPYVLAAMIIQEQGTTGSSGLISGTSSGYYGYYNFYNIEAYQSGSMSATERGLWWASQSGSYGRPWNTKEKAIIGGAQFYGENYTKANQNTFYLKKFNVRGSNLYKHQFMTNIQAAASEGSKLSEAYTAEMKKTALDFEIPVYKNMPDQLSICPTGDGSPNNKLQGLGVDGFALTPTFSRDILSYDLIVDPSVDQVKIWAQPYDTGAAVEGTGQVILSSASNTISIVVTARNETKRTYTINIVRQANGPTYSAGVGSMSSSGPGSSGSSYGPGMDPGSYGTPAAASGSSGGPSAGSSGSSATKVQITPAGTGTQQSSSASNAPASSGTSSARLAAPGQ